MAMGVEETIGSSIKFPTSGLRFQLRCVGISASEVPGEHYVAVSVRDDHGDHQELGQSERVPRNLSNPVYGKRFTVDLWPTRSQNVQVELFNQFATSDTPLSMGLVEFSTQELQRCAEMESESMGFPVYARNHHAATAQGQVVVSWCRQVPLKPKANLVVRFAGAKLDNKDGLFGTGFLGKSDPFLKVYCSSDHGISWVLRWTSDVVMDTLDPVWKEVTFALDDLCDSDESSPLKIECYDWEPKEEKNALIGCCFTRVDEWEEGLQLDLVNPELQHKKGKKYTNSGVLKILTLRRELQPGILDYMRGGCDVELVVGVDFSRNNGSDVSDPQCLHHHDAKQLNEYQKALSVATHTILERYMTKTSLYGYGFGAGSTQYDPEGFFPFCEGEIDGVEELMGQYSRVVGQVVMKRSCRFAPLIKHVSQIARDAAQRAPKKYHVLLLLTQGKIDDLKATIDTIVDASTSEFPLSIIIVGIGNGDFREMKRLDADGNKMLVASDGRPACRDLVQFVPFAKFTDDLDAFAKELCLELPSQLVRSMRTRHILPQAA